MSESLMSNKYGFFRKNVDTNNIHCISRKILKLTL